MIRHMDMIDLTEINSSAIANRSDSENANGSNVVDMTEATKALDKIDRSNGGRGGTLNRYGLTDREERYCLAQVKGMNKTASYRAAYNTDNMSPVTVNRRAIDVACRPKVKARLAMLMEASEASASHDAERARLFIQERLYEEACNDKNKPMERLKAIELLGKLTDIGAFTERQAISTTNMDSIDAVKEKIAALIKDIA